MDNENTVLKVVIPKSLDMSSESIDLFIQTIWCYGIKINIKL